MYYGDVWGKDDCIPELGFYALPLCTEYHHLQAQHPSSMLWSRNIFLYLLTQPASPVTQKLLPIWYMHIISNEYKISQLVYTSNHACITMVANILAAINIETFPFYMRMVLARWFALYPLISRAIKPQYEEAIRLLGLLSHSGKNLW